MILAKGEPTWWGEVTGWFLIHLGMGPEAVLVVMAVAAVLGMGLARSTQ